MSFVSHLRKARRAGIRKQMLKSRQSNAKTLMNKLATLYKEATINDVQKEEIARLRVEQTTKTRELAEKYMEKEIKIIEDLGGKYIAKPELIKAKA